ncbi:MAG: hybrid sensor histidine kinase/response regulator [Methylococcaceae bacterium]|nr:hybrid sensor histidine kinase/response regulator [Methylococcaceae bacterium]
MLALKEQSRLQAEQQNQDKSKFMANAAHDLRNVMQPVENFLDVSLSALTRGDTQQTQEYLNEAIIANKVLCSAVNALLEISGLQSGIINLQLSSFDVRVMAAEVMQTSQSQAEQHKVKLLLSKAHSGPAIVHSDRQHLKRILANLVVNAIKYADTHKGDAATVAVAIISHAKHIRLDVLDNGIGIPLAEQENIFKPLHQLHNPARDRDKGIGLGLSIVDATLKLLRDHHIKLSSKPGCGTRFSLILPKGEASAPDELEQPTHDLSNDLSELYVLLVENDLLVKRSMVALLQANHAQYEAVSTLAELHSLLPTLARYPDIVVTDYRLSDDCTAVDVISAIQAAFGKDLPTLILTGETADLSPLLADRTILHKPIAARQLLAEISQLTQGKFPI